MFNSRDQYHTYQNIKNCFQLVRERIPAEQNIYSDGTPSHTNCLCVQLVPLLVPSFRLIPGFYVSPLL